MRVFANYDTCVASGNCGRIAPAVFRNLAEHEGFVSLVTDHPPAAEWPAVRQAQQLCPSGTIFLDETTRAEGEPR
ncbi:ferredoxin [Corynebacterium hylobatis]|uniref:Ferredoxin n=1 Tax=Corynebacterium hylobatis TaxID=1859290 RepID=A0A3S0BHH0_9CORY|nr:ferredoxin [Corynebacterium hylobatis]RSZ63203.1 ferredoxin [Corynebacterium hylobatis]